jgi:hypothetical protein
MNLSISRRDLFTASVVGILGMMRELSQRMSGGNRAAVRKAGKTRMTKIGATAKLNEYPNGSGQVFYYDTAAPRIGFVPRGKLLAVYTYDAKTGKVLSAPDIPCC